VLPTSITSPGFIERSVREARENRWVIAVFAVISLPMLF
jgi:hypothetical protein